MEQGTYYFYSTCMNDQSARNVTARTDECDLATKGMKGVFIIIRLHVYLYGHYFSCCWNGLWEAFGELLN